MKKLKIIIGFFFLTTGLFAYAGKVSAVVGEVVIQRAAAEIKAKTGTEIEESDLIVTKGNSRVQLYFKDDTIISIGKNSEFRVEAFLFDEDKENKANVASFGIAKGAFKVMTGKIGKIAPQAFKLQSRTATIGIRGTHFLGQISDESDVVACTDGKISVGTIDGQHEVLVNAGQITTIVPGQPPTPPRDFSPEELGKLTKASGNGDGAKKEEPAKEEDTKEESKTEPKETVSEISSSVSEVMESVIGADKTRSLENLEDYDYIEYWLNAFNFADSYTAADLQTLVDTEVASIASYLGDYYTLKILKSSVGLISDNNIYLDWGALELSFGISLDLSGIDPSYFDGMATSYAYYEKLYFILGTPTGYTELSNLQQTLTTPVTYTGNLVGTIYEDVPYDPYIDYIAAGTTVGYVPRDQILATSTFSTTIDFATGQVLDGSVAIETASGGQWDMTIDSAYGPYYSNSFSASLSDSTGTKSASLNGQFFGANAEAIGGTFSGADSVSGYQAIGVFQGKR